MRLAALFAVTCAVLAAPLVLSPHLPLVDLPNHIARLYIAAHREGALGQYFSYTLTQSPNQAVDLIWVALGYPGEAERFANVVMAGTVVNFVGAAMVLSRIVHGRWSAWPLAAGLLVYNAPFWWGFQNFLVTVPFALYALALWLWMEQRATSTRTLIFIPIALALYLMHLFAFGAFAVAAFGREVQRVGALRTPQATWTLIVSMTPFGVVAAVLAQRLVFGPANPNGGGLLWQTPDQRLQALGSAFGVAGGELVPPAFTWQVMLVALLIIAVLLRRTSAPGMTFAPVLLGPVVALGVLCLVIPANINGVALVHIRYPVVTLAVLIAGLDVVRAPVALHRLLPFVLIAVVAARGVMFHGTAQTYSTRISDIERLASAHLTPGDLVVPVRAEEKFRWDTRHWHSVAHLVPEAQVFVPTLFQGVHNLILRPEWQDRAIPAGFPPPAQQFLAAADRPGPLYFDAWPTKFSHVLVLDAGTLDHPALTLAGTSGAVSLYRVKKPDT